MTDKNYEPLNEKILKSSLPSEFNRSHDLLETLKCKRIEQEKIANKLKNEILIKKSQNEDIDELYE